MESVLTFCFCINANWVPDLREIISLLSISMLSWDMSYLIISYLLWRASLVGERLKCLPAMQETWVRSLGQEDPQRRKWQPTPVFLPGESHGCRSLVGYSPRGSKESDTTELLHFHFIFSGRSLSWSRYINFNRHSPANIAYAYFFSLYPLIC